METYREIYTRISQKCSDNWCQSVPVVAECAMEEAVRLDREQVIEDLYAIVNANVFTGVINKSTIENYINKLEQQV